MNILNGITRGQYLSIDQFVNADGFAIEVQKGTRVLFEYDSIEEGAKVQLIKNLKELIEQLEE